MKDKHYFEIATREFSYLVTEFGYEIIDIESPWYSQDIYYQNDNLQVKIAFAWYDNMFSVYIIRTDKKEKDNKSLAELLNPDNEHKFSFTNLLFALKHTDKKMLSPVNHTGYDETVQYHAKLLKELGTDFLLGNKWPSFDNLSNKKVQVDILEIKDNNVTKETEHLTTVDQLKNLLKRKKK